mmetsp:Transcript_61430/g.158473  ORF Transcript_61430/g.158473 Transcript_61430/m.158473 type:complete len:306 (-) Transcript_61430:1293-2210(-)
MPPNTWMWTLVPPKPCALTPAKTTDWPIAWFSSPMSTGHSCRSRCGFSCRRCTLGVTMPHRMLCSILTKPATPAVSMQLPALVFMVPSCIISSVSPVPPRSALPSEATSTASEMSLLVPCTSTTSTSNGMMPDFRHASRSTACSAGPLGAESVEVLPLLAVAPPTMVPTSGWLSSTTSWPSTTSALLRMTAQPVASILAWPVAVASNVKQRPSGLRKPAALCAGHQAFARIRETPMPQARSWIWPVPFFSTASAAQNTADSEEAASVSMAKLAPLQPKQKLRRPAQILGAPPVAPKIPMSADRSA